MKKTTKIILGSALTMALSASLIAGSTLALFSSESKVNVAITSGQVLVDASVNQESLKGYSANWNGDAYGEQSVSDGNFTTGGTYSYEAGSHTLKLEHIAPGDGVEFTLDITNSSTIDTKYRVQVTASEDDEGELYKALEFSFGEKKSIKFTDLSAPVYGDWQDLKKDTGSTSISVKIKLPITDAEQNDYQNKSCTLTVSVYAMQANGHAE